MMLPVTVNVDLTKPATVLIEKVSDAVGAIAKPWQIKRVAQAEVEAELIRAKASVEISDIQQRGLVRLIEEGGKKQENIENVVYKSIPFISDDAKPECVENDWYVHFFKHSSSISDEQMQILWARILAGEANSPGSFSKRTVDFVGSMDKKEADMFTKICSFAWGVGGINPIVYDINDDIVKSNIGFSEIKLLESIGLITVDILSGYSVNSLNKVVNFPYYGRNIIIEFDDESGNVMDIGKILFTNIGRELFSMCGSKPCEGYFNGVLDRWYSMGYVLSSDIDSKPHWKLEE